VWRLEDCPRFPCSRITKAPLIAGGFKAATTDANQIAAWQAQFPWTLWGIPCGETFDVLDLDGPAGLYWLRENELPETRVQFTPRGRHYYFHPVAGLRPSVGRVAKGCDVRSHGSYVIAWGLEGLRTVERPLAPWPPWLLARAATKNETCTRWVGSDVSTQWAHPPFEPTINLCRRTERILRVVEDAKPGTRNSRLYWAACRFGEIVAEGRLQLVVAEQLLRSAAHLCGLVRDDGARAVMATIVSGLRRGSRHE
jgi:putative DNA primase/helicase